MQDWNLCTVCDAAETCGRRYVWTVRQLYQDSGGVQEGSLLFTYHLFELNAFLECTGGTHEIEVQGESAKDANMEANPNLKGCLVWANFSDVQFTFHLQLQPLNFR